MHLIKYDPVVGFTNLLQRFTAFHDELVLLGRARRGDGEIEPGILVVIIFILFLIVVALQLNIRTFRNLGAILVNVL